MTLTDLRLDIDGQIAVITLERPDACNAYSEAMVASLVEAIDLAEADRDVRCVVVTGAGSAFSAGGDLKLVAIAERAQHRLHRKYWRLVSTGKPRNKALVAVARELVGFIWAVLTLPTSRAASATRAA